MTSEYNHDPARNVFSKELIAKEHPSFPRARYHEHPDLPGKYIRWEEYDPDILDTMRYKNAYLKKLDEDFDIPSTPVQYIVTGHKGVKLPEQFTLEGEMVKNELVEMPTLKIGITITDSVPDAIPVKDMLERTADDQDVFKEFDELFIKHMRYLKSVYDEGGVVEAEALPIGQYVYSPSAAEGKRLVLVDLEPMGVELIQPQENRQAGYGTAALIDKLPILVSNILTLERASGQTASSRDVLLALISLIDDGNVEAMQWAKASLLTALETSDTSTLEAFYGDSHIEEENERWMSFLLSDLKWPEQTAEAFQADVALQESSASDLENPNPEDIDTGYVDAYNAIADALNEDIYFQYATHKGLINSNLLPKEKRDSQEFKDFVAKFGWPTSADNKSIKIPMSDMYGTEGEPDYGEFLDAFLSRSSSGAKANLDNFRLWLVADPSDTKPSSSIVPLEYPTHPALHRLYFLMPDLMDAVHFLVKDMYVRNMNARLFADEMSAGTNGELVKAIFLIYQVAGRLLKKDDRRLHREIMGLPKRKAGQITDAHAELRA